MFLSQFPFMELFIGHNCSKDGIRWTLIFKFPFLFCLYHVLLWKSLICRYLNIIVVFFFKNAMDHNTLVMLKPLFYHYNQIPRMGWRKGGKKRPWHIAYPSASWSQSCTIQHPSDFRTRALREKQFPRSQLWAALPFLMELSSAGWSHLDLGEQIKAVSHGEKRGAIRACRWGARLALFQSHTAQWLAECPPRASPEKESTKGPVGYSQQGPSGWPCRSLLWARPSGSSLYDSCPSWVTFLLLKPQVTESKILCMCPLLVREPPWF